ncbi:hypothetical protein SS50377_23452 [Spironucleus salmonicida]|uniref:Uncharacterized protein n=1 Tax=Spironucleus salmonicida TaxID=348837 RepID=V6LZE5_9EUKA|nr:hypothetical protein SS50377_23452 [Spironucleus salmonicida]|eukprot:EST46189.1 Hypothetical protein SS50377_13784 [Spironucleus salmonicida]
MNNFYEGIQILLKSQEQNDLVHKDVLTAVLNELGIMMRIEQNYTIHNFISQLKQFIHENQMEFLMKTYQSAKVKTITNSTLQNISKNIGMYIQDIDYIQEEYTLNTFLKQFDI